MPIAMGFDRKPGEWVMAINNGSVMPYDRAADLHGAVKTAIAAQIRFAVVDARPDGTAADELLSALRALNINAWRAAFVRNVDVFEVGNQVVRINRVAAAPLALTREEDDAGIYAWVADRIAAAGTIGEPFTLVRTMADTLNRLRQIDPAVADTLVHIRLQCSPKLIDDPSIIVGVSDAGRCTLGLLGVLNGILIDAGCTQRIAYVTNHGDADAGVIEFRAVDWDGVVITANPPAMQVV